MSAPDIAYRLACTPPAALGGTMAKLVALLIACRWAQVDGRFVVRQASIVDASGLSKASVVRAVAALRTVRVIIDIGAEECCLTADHLPGGLLSASGRLLTEHRTDRAQVAHRARSAPTATNRTQRVDDPPSAPGISQQPPGLPQQPNGRPGTESLNRKPDVSVSSLSSSDSNEGGEEGDARTGTGEDEPFAEGLDDFTDIEVAAVEWLRAEGALMSNPETGEDLRREWLQATVGLGGKLVGQIMATRTGNFPSHFKRACEAFTTQVEAARRAFAAKRAAEIAAADEARREEAEARFVRERAAEEERDRLALAAAEARERGPFLEQAVVLLREIDKAESRRLAMACRANGRFTSVLARVRAGVAAGRISSFDLTCLRGDWIHVRERELPPEPVEAVAVADEAYPDPAQADP